MLSSLIIWLLVVIVLIAVLYFVVRSYVDRIKKDQKEEVAKLLHDLKSPLSSIIGYVELLKTKERSIEQQEEFLGIIEFESEKLLQMLTSGLSESSGTEPPRNSTNCAKIISLISRGLSPDAAKKGITIEYQCDPEVYVDFDETKLWRVISNLAENSIKYNKPNGKIKISVISDSDSVIIECEDTGIGIRSENISKVFEKGYRENNKLPGFGYGLSTVKQIVTLNGGSITLESEYGIGTKFTLKLRKAEPELCNATDESLIANQ